MKDLRLISLCSVQCKIISKLLSDERLKPVMPIMVSDMQEAFVEGRLISDNIIVAHEMVHGLRTNNSVNEKFMAIKTDISNAYDHVKWSFLETLMEKMGFARKWVCWVMACVSTMSYTILLNGREHGFIRPERGIRQGDPISPFLFIICAEALVSVLNVKSFFEMNKFKILKKKKKNNAESKGRLHGIQLAAGGPSVHHLLFADDSLLLCQANMAESVEILRCLNLYGDLVNRLIHQNLL